MRTAVEETRLARITDDLEEATGAATCTSVVDDWGSC